MAEPIAHPASYRDPAGFLFEAEGRLFRQVNKSFAASYDRLMQSGLYEALREKGWLVAHRESDQPGLSADAYRVIEPERLPLISYPYEWSFGQLQDAALLTLQIHRLALDFGLSLKDATPFNVQFHQGRPLFIDSLSFEPYEEGKPWIAYRQFCENFLFPLLLQQYRDSDSIRWLRIYPDGIPVELTARLLPYRCRFRLDTWMHVYLPNRVRKQASANGPLRPFSRKSMQQLILQLQNMVSRLKPGKPAYAHWSNYYGETILGAGYLEAKEKILKRYLENIAPCLAHDMGSNDGHFSRLLAERGFQVLATDADPVCIQQLYERCKKDGSRNLLPLLADICNPSPALGFANRERSAFDERFKPDLVLALALLHHLAIGRNLPLPLLASYLAGRGSWLIAEFVPKEDPKVQELLRNRPDIFPDYDQAHFEEAFGKYYQITEREKVSGTERILYKMKRIAG